MTSRHLVTTCTRLRKLKSDQNQAHRGGDGHKVPILAKELMTSLSCGDMTQFSLKLYILGSLPRSSRRLIQKCVNSRNWTRWAGKKGHKVV